MSNSAICLTLLLLYGFQINAQHATPEETAAKKQLERLLDSYPDRTAWENRKLTLRECFFKTFHFDKLPEHKVKLIKTKTRKYKGYTVQNIALETLPGVFVCGSVYRPTKKRGKLPLVICPNGHFAGGRYRPDQQYLNATLARMGAITFSYDLFGWGESRLQVREEDHYTPTAMLIQTWNNIKILDYLSALPETDTNRIAMTGASGGGSQTMLLAALDPRIKLTIPVVMLSAHFPGGCPCETGLPVHECGGGTNNAEVAAMTAPRPQMVISIDSDWTRNVPETEFPYLKKIYALYNAGDQVFNIHLRNEEHNYGREKRQVAYDFLVKQFGLRSLKNASDSTDESGSVIEKENLLLVFGNKGEKLPAYALRSLNDINKMLKR